MDNDKTKPDFDWEACKSQILAIRATGKTNMFDINMVQRMAFDMGHFELVSFIESHKKAYVSFIMHGEEPQHD